MLDHELVEQLKEVFTKLENKVEINYYQSNHPKQSELLEMLQDLSTTSKSIELHALGDFKDHPHFSIDTANKRDALHFAGIPGGHEFTSLILAILNSDLKGKLPDQSIINRIKNIKGPIHLQTYISLSCENCPEVVQALNLMAIIHPQFTHEMRDGEFFQNEIEQLKIQGVPSVIANGKMISSGKTDFMGLLAILEKEFGKVEVKSPTPTDLGHFDVVVIGGGPAGASAAIYSARKGLKTAIIAERIGGQVKDTKGIENLISVPYTEGPQLANELDRHLQAYPITKLEHRRVLSLTNGAEKKMELDSGELLSAKAIIVATGAKWRELGIPGEKEYLGRGVAFCPHCDGPFYKGKDIAVVGGGNSGVEAAIDLAGLVNSVTLFEYMPELKADTVLVNKLRSLANVSIITNAKTTKVMGENGKVIGLEYLDRQSQEIKVHTLQGIFVQIGLSPNAQVVKDLVEINKAGEIIIDEKCRTSAQGIYAAGDVTNVPYKQIIISMGEGAKAALTAFEDLKLR